MRIMKATPLTMMGLILVTVLVDISLGDSDDEGSCYLDGRLSSLRCENSCEWRTVRSRLNATTDSVLDNIFVNYCDIRVIPSPLLLEFAEKNIRKIVVANSGLQRLSANSFSGLETVLEVLDLSNNGLTTFPKALLNLTRLTSLDLRKD